jgi:hypothetical protein
MSIYSVNLFCRRVVHEAEFCELVKRDPEVALGAFDLEPAEREALRAGDVATLYALGAHEYLLMGLGRRGVFGLDIPTFSARIREAEPRFDY